MFIRRVEETAPQEGNMTASSRTRDNNFCGILKEQGIGNGQLDPT
jgi:hypothetical protein